MKNILIFSLMLVSCGKYYADPRAILTTDAAFTPYIKDFETLYGKKINNIPINFGNTANVAFIAVCRKWSDFEKDIIVKKEVWNMLSKEQKQELIFHELGHCELNLEHISNYTYNVNNPYICPISIMNPQVFNDYSISYCYNANINYYTNKLFNR